MKLDYKKTFILGFGFFAVSLVWPLYNTYIPLFLRDYLDSQFLINGIMTLDNLLAVSLIPIIAAMSDNTNTRFGRRMPYLMVGIPLAALMFVLVPMYTSFWYLIVTLFVLNISMAIFRAPTVALMPDITPVELRSEANGVINFMGGLAAVIVLAAGSLLFDVNKLLPFALTSVLMIFALFVLMRFIKEPTIAVKAKEDKVNIVHSVKEILVAKDRSIIYALLAVFFWFVGYQGIQATFSNYCVEFLGLPKSQPGLILAVFAATFLIFSIPAGFIGKRFGKKKTLIAGLIGDTVVFLLLAFIGTQFPYNQTTFMILMALAGFFWALININSYPLIVGMTSESHIGTYTGLYYFASSLAAILGPLFLGAFIDIIDFGVMFPLTGLAYVIAIICMLRVNSSKN